MVEPKGRKRPEVCATTRVMRRGHSGAELAWSQGGADGSTGRGGVRGFEASGRSTHQCRAGELKAQGGSELLGKKEPNLYSGVISMRDVIAGSCTCSGLALCGSGTTVGSGAV